MGKIATADISRTDFNTRPSTILDFLSARSYLLNVLPMTPLVGSSTLEIVNWATASGVGVVAPDTGNLSAAARTQATTSVTTYSTVNIASTLEMTRYDLARSSIQGFEQSAVRNVLEAMGTNYATRCFRGAAVGTNIFSGIVTLVPSGNTHSATGTDGGPVLFDDLDTVIDRLSPSRRGANFGQIVGFASSAAYRSLRALLRTSSSTSGVRIDALEALNLPGGTEFPQDILFYNGIPIFKDDLTPLTAKGSATGLASIIFAVLDDGSRTQGIGGFYTPPAPEEGLLDYGMGVHAVPIGGNHTDAIMGYNYGMVSWVLCGRSC